MGIAGGVLVDGDQARHAAAALILAAHRMTRALGRDHHHIEARTGLDQVEMDIEAMGEGNGRTVADLAVDLVLPDVGLQLVGRAHHHEIGRLGGLGDAQHAEAVGLRLPRPVAGLAALEGDGVGVASVTVSRPSLDDVYLRATGRAFGAAHGEEEA